MINRENVIKGLETCYCHPAKCEDCPYHDIENCNDALCSDAIALMKEQVLKEQCLKTKCVICPHCDNCDVDEKGRIKEQEIVPVQKREIHHLFFFACGSCGTVITDGDRFCRMCGKKVKWK